MINVDIENLKNDVYNLKKLIDEYEDIKMNLFYQLKESTTNWQDGNSIKFSDKIYLEKNETDLLLQSLKEKSDIFNYIHNKYSEFGKKILCNLNEKNTLINSINNCYNQAVSIVNEFNYIDRSFYYDEMYSIQNQKNKIITVKNKLAEIKNEVLNLYKKIEEIENEVSIKIKRLEEIKINNFDFNI